MSEPTLKAIAEDFLILCAKGDSREAFSLYASPKLIHHNAYFAGDPATLMIAMEEANKANPDMVFQIQRALEDGELVAVHSHYRQNPDDLGYVVAHIMKFDENKKIVEFWDFGQQIQKDCPNENGVL